MSAVDRYGALPVRLARSMQSRFGCQSSDWQAGQSSRCVRVCSTIDCILCARSEIVCDVVCREPFSGEEKWWGDENSSRMNRLERFFRIFQLQDPIFLKKDSVGINIIASNLGPFFATVRASAWPCLASILTRLRLFPGIHNGTKAVMKSYYNFCTYCDHVIRHCFMVFPYK